MGYSYPIDPSWTRDELLSVMALFQIVEKAYEKGVAREEVAAAYRHFSSFGFSKAELKQLDRDFMKVSGYSIYRVIKACQDGEKFIRLKVKA